MKRLIPWLVSLALLALVILSCASSVVLFFWGYTNLQLANAQRTGVYSSAEEGMRALIARSYQQPERSEIIYAGTNSFDGSSPHVWYVIACVWGGKRADGSPVGTPKHVYDQPGVYFINTRAGWVFMPEGAFPEVIGFWMQVFRLAGPGSATPSHDWGSGPASGCSF